MREGKDALLVNGLEIEIDNKAGTTTYKGAVSLMRTSLQIAQYLQVQAAS